MLKIIENCSIFDGVSEEIYSGRSIIIEGDVIQDIVEGVPLGYDDAQRIDAGDRFLMPGLIDAHFHSYGIDANPVAIDEIPHPVRSLHAAKLLEETLARGYTTVRDAAGGDRNLAIGLSRGLINGPRLFYPGLALSQTGGHGDLRNPDHVAMCACGYCGALATVVDGPDEVRKAVREQLRMGASHIKLMVSGGVLSPTDPIWMNQFSDEEIRIAVDEAATRRCYVMVHAHMSDAVVRSVRNGVRSIEHATWIDRAAADSIVQHNAFAVPTLAIINALTNSGRELGLSSAMMDKCAEVSQHALQSLSHLRSAGAKIGFGTDLLGTLVSRQSSEFRLRREVLDTIEILRSVTSINAALLQMEGRLGCIQPGAFADLLILERSPFEDIGVFEAEGGIQMVMRAGKIISSSL